MGILAEGDLSAAEVAAVAGRQRGRGGGHKLGAHQERDLLVKRFEVRQMG